MKKFLSFILCLCLCCGLFSAASADKWPPVPAFLDALGSFVRSLSLETKDYEASLFLPDQQLQGSVRQGNGLTEIELAGLGKAQIDEKNVVLNTNGITVICDYQSLIRSVQDLVSGKGNAQITAYLNKLSQRALSELVFPFAEYAVDFGRFVFHLDFSSAEFLNHFYDFLIETAQDEEFISAYACLGPVLRAGVPGMPDQADEFVSLLRKAKTETNYYATPWTLKADLSFSYAEGVLKDFSLSGYFADGRPARTAKRYSGYYPFSLDISADQADYVIKANVDLPFGRLDLSYLRGQIECSLSDTQNQMIRFVGGYDRQKESLDLVIHDSLQDNPIGSVKATVSRELLDADIRYYHDRITLYAKLGQSSIHVRFKSNPYSSDKYSQYDSYDWDLRFSEEPNHEYRLTANIGINRSYHSLDGLIGPYRVSIRYSPSANSASFYGIGFKAEYKQLNAGFDFSAEYQNTLQSYYNRKYENNSVHRIHLTGRNNVYEVDFSYPYQQFRIDGNGKITLSSDSEIASISGQAVARNTYDPEADQDTSILTYVPGRLYISALQSVILLERLQDDDHALVYQLSRNAEPLYQLECSLIETEQGTGLSVCFSDISVKKDASLAMLTLSPVDKTDIVPLDTSMVIGISAETLIPLISQLLSGSLLADR